MSLCNCSCRCNCSIAALVVSAIIGIIGAFLQITGVITLTPVVLWAALGAAAVLLGILVLSVRCRADACTCSALDALLAGILVTILAAAILLAVGITATSVISAVLVGLLLFGLGLLFTSASCYVRQVSGCGN